MLSMTCKLSMHGVALQGGSAMCQTYRGRSAVRVGRGHDAGHSCRTRQPAWCRATDAWYAWLQDHGLPWAHRPLQSCPPST